MPSSKQEHPIILENNSCPLGNLVVISCDANLLCSFQHRLLAHNGQRAAVHKLWSTQSRCDLVLQGNLYSTQWAQRLLAI